MKMIDAACANYQSIGDDLLGLADYYQEILGRSSLASKEHEFRTNKLSLIMDLIKTLSIPESLTLELTVAIIDGWLMSVPGSASNPNQISEDQRNILRSLEEIRDSVRWSKLHSGPDARLRLDIAVQFALPLMPSDLAKEGNSRVKNLLSQSMDCLALALEYGTIAGTYQICQESA